jgi:hypothetical protein
MRLRHKNSNNKHKTDTFRKDRTLPGMQIDTLSSTEISRLIKFPCLLFEMFMIESNRLLNAMRLFS